MSNRNYVEFQVKMNCYFLRQTSTSMELMFVEISQEFYSSKNLNNSVRTLSL